jgi:transposase
VRYSRGNRLGHVAPTGADAAAPSGRSGKRGAGPEAWLMKDLAWAWKVLKHLLRDLRKPSWIVAHFAKKDRHITLQYVRHCRQKWEKYGDPAYKRRRVRRGALIWEHRQWIVQQFEEDPALFFDEVQDRFQDQYGRGVTDQQISAVLASAGYTLKRLERRAAQRCAIQRDLYRRAVPGIAKGRLAFMDESHAADRDFRRRRGWSRRGRPAFIHEFFVGGRANCSVIAVITDRGFEANMCDVVLGNVDGDALLDWAESCLFPGLSTNPADRCSYLILDNCPVHYDPRFLDRLKVRTDSHRPARLCPDPPLCRACLRTRSLATCSSPPTPPITTRSRKPSTR